LARRFEDAREDFRMVGFSAGGELAGGFTSGWRSTRLNATEGG
jgi:hypothetical protein